MYEKFLDKLCTDLAEIVNEIKKKIESDKNE